MPYRQSISAAANENHQKLLSIWREQRAFRVGKTLSSCGLVLSAIAVMADSLWSNIYVISTDFILLFGCGLSFYWTRQKVRPAFFWWPLFWGLWISVIPSLWSTGGLNSPFFGLSMSALFVIASVMDIQDRSAYYFGFLCLHIPAFYVLEKFYKFSASPLPELPLSAAVTGLTFCSIFVCIYSMLRTERELSMEFTEHYRELSKAEEQLKKNAAQLHEAQSIAQMGNWEWDIDGDHIFWSDELFKIFDVKKESFNPSYSAYLQRLNPSVRSMIDKKVQESLSTGKEFTFENHVKTSMGERFISSRGRVIKDADGRVIKMFGTSQDVTERKRIESELVDARQELEERVVERTVQLAQSLNREKAAKQIAENASQAKMQFLANMSHEIRTPMNSILGFSDLLSMEDYSPSEVKKYVERIRTNGKQLLHLINDILDLSKFEAGVIPLNKEYFSLKSLVDEVISSFMPHLQAKGIDLQLNYQGDLSKKIFTDAHRLSQILNNLLSNAVKFSENGQVKINIAMSPLGENKLNLLFDIEDSGIGISEENQKDLFQAFRQGDSSIARKFGGSGLGLALSRRLARVLGGELSLVKSAPDKGSHFCFNITADQASDESVYNNLAELSQQPLSAEVLKGKNILIAEDSQDNALLICHYVKSTGVLVDLAADGLQAVQKVQQHNYDCILMDIQMPGMDGLEATRKIRESGYKNPIIALTAHALPTEVEKSLNAGCNLHLTKPITKHELIRALADQIKN